MVVTPRYVYMHNYIMCTYMCPTSTPYLPPILHANTEKTAGGGGWAGELTCRIMILFCMMIVTNQQMLYNVCTFSGCLIVNDMDKVIIRYDKLMLHVPPHGRLSSTSQHSVNV